MYDGPVTDACVFHEWPSTLALTRYMSDGWKELLGRPGDRKGSVNVRAQRRYAEPLTKAAGSYPGKDLPGSDFELLESHALEVTARDPVVLGVDVGLLA